MNRTERNHGCRYQEIYIHGFKSIILENEVLRITMILDKGCEIVEFNYKKMDLDFTWRLPNGLGSLKNYAKNFNDDLILTDYYSGGWFEAFPSGGMEGDYFGAHLPIYGEACYLPWDYQILKDDEKEIILKVFCRMIRSPFYVEKTISIKSYEPALMVEESITNLSMQKVHFNIGYHPNFGSSFIDHDLEFNMPECEVEILWTFENSRFQLGEKGLWPFLKDKDGNPTDLRNVPEKNSKVNEIISLKGLKKGYMEIKNKDKNINLLMSFDQKIFKNAILWIVRNGDSGYPRYGTTNVICMLPKSNHQIKNKDISSHKDYIEISQDETVKTWIKYEVTLK